MSEYQYYEFRAIDRPLTRGQQEELRRLSTRAEITPNSFTNFYTFGNFKGRPDALMEQYFDAFVSVTNWGSYQLQLRIPSRILDADTVAPYTDDDHLTVRRKGENIILTLNRRDDLDSEETDGEEWLDRLIGLRDELMRGDHRSLYLGWLGSFLGRGWGSGADLDFDYPTEGEVEPPVPPGLTELSDSLAALVEFLDIDPNLLAAAAVASPSRVVSEPTPIDQARWLRGLPVAQKDLVLLRLLSGEGVGPLRAELLRDFQAATGRAAGPASQPRRTVDQLIDAFLEEEAQAEQRQAQAKVKQQQARERADLAARDGRIKALRSREVAAWAEADALIATKLPKKYDQAAALLADLVELARREGRIAEVHNRLRDLRLRHASKRSLIKRLDALQV